MNDPRYDNEAVTDSSNRKMGAPKETDSCAEVDAFFVRSPGAKNNYGLKNEIGI